MRVARELYRQGECHWLYSRWVVVGHATREELNRREGTGGCLTGKKYRQGDRTEVQYGWTLKLSSHGTRKLTGLAGKGKRDTVRKREHAQ